jgi:tryptophan synthase alpha chain
MTNPIKELFRSREKNILSIYFTAGFPEINDTLTILDELQKSGADMIEIGMPFSDPLADGSTIQHSSEKALKNGMTLKFLFKQLEKRRTHNQYAKVPLVFMGYLNPVLQFGVEEFCRKANQVGISVTILPDLPFEEYLSGYKPVFEKYNLKNIFLITPQTSEKRIRMIDKNSDGFIYAVSSASTTGTKLGMNEEKKKFFQCIKKMKLKNPVMIGFGVSDKESFDKACEYANGAIIGSAFIKALGEGVNISDFIKTVVDCTRKAKLTTTQSRSSRTGN